MQSWYKNFSYEDLYVNQIVQRMNLLYGKNKKVVIISYWGKEHFDKIRYWQNAPRILGR